MANHAQNPSAVTAATVFKFNAIDVRTAVNDNGEPLFCAADVCDVLGYANASLTITKHCKVGGVSKRYTPTASGAQEMAFITEGNLYRLIIKSRKPEAEAFESWVMDEVLPSIRKTGEYRIPYVTSPNDVLTASQAEELRTIIRAAADKLPKPQQAGFTIKAWSKMKSHFGVTYRKIPQREFSEAISLAARHVAEWELIDAPKLAAPTERNDKGMVRADLAQAIRRDFDALAAATQELNRRMRICFGEIDVSDLGAPLAVTLDKTAFA